MGTGASGVSVIVLTGATRATSTVDASTVATTAVSAGGLISATGLVAVATSSTVTEGTLATTGATAVVTSAGGPQGSLGLSIALGSASGSLVDGLDRDDGLLLAIGVVTEIGKRVLGDDRHLVAWAYRLPWEGVDT
jgi:hypothetical protein